MGYFSSNSLRTREAQSGVKAILNLILGILRGCNLSLSNLGSDWKLSGRCIYYLKGPYQIIET